MSSPEVYRPTSSRWLAGAVLALVSLGVTSLVVSGTPAEMLRFAPPLLLGAVVAWAAFWAPAVVIGDAGVTLHNVLRTVHLPWSAIQRVDTRWALALVTPGGSWTAWAAPTSSRRLTEVGTRDEVRGLPETTYGPGGTIRTGDLPSAPSGQAAALVRLRWEALRDAGALDDASPEQQRAQVSWHTGTLAALAALGAASVLGFVATHG